MAGETSLRKLETMTQMVIWRKDAPVLIPGSRNLKYLQIFIMKQSISASVVLPLRGGRFNGEKKKKSLKWRMGEHMKMNLSLERGESVGNSSDPGRDNHIKLV